MTAPRVTAAGQVRAIVRVQRIGKRWWVTHGDLRLPCETQSGGVCEARVLAQLHAAGGGLAQVVVHRADGRIRTEWTYGADPVRHKG